MYEKGVLKCRYKKGKLVKGYRSAKGEKGEERKYKEVNIRGKKKTQRENKNGDDNDENEKAILIDEKKNGDSIQIRLQKIKGECYELHEGGYKEKNIWENN